MLELQRIQLAGWALTEGQHRPKAGKKKTLKFYFELFNFQLEISNFYVYSSNELTLGTLNFEILI